MLDAKQYSPKIMHAQEGAQEVLAPQEHASGEKKLNCALLQELPNARSSKSYLQEAARSPTANRKYPQEVYSSWLNQQ